MSEHIATLELQGAATTTEKDELLRRLDDGNEMGFKLEHAGDCTFHVHSEADR